MDSGKFFAHIGLAVLSSLGGLFHIVYCCLFFTSGVGVWNALLLVGVALYGLCRWRPGPRFLVYSHLMLIGSAALVMALNAMGIQCSSSSCNAQSWSRPMQQACLSKFAQKPALLQGMGRVHTAIHALLLLESSLQMALCATVVVRSSFGFFEAVKHQLNAFYLQSLVGLLGVGVGCVHALYCSHLFFLAVGIWAGLGLCVCGCLRNRSASPERRKIQSLLAPIAGRRPSTRDRTLKWLSIGFGVALVAVGAFGGYCWQPIDFARATPTPQNLSQPTPKLACSAPSFAPGIYRSCYEGLETVGLWHRSIDADLKGAAKLQQGMSVLLLLCGLAALALALWIELRRMHKEKQQRKAVFV